MENTLYYIHTFQINTYIRSLLAAVMAFIIFNQSVRRNRHSYTMYTTVRNLFITFTIYNGHVSRG